MKNTLIDTIREFILIGIAVTLIYWLLAPDRDRSFQPVSMVDLKGVWTTSNPRYQDRFLQFSEDTVTFGRGKEGIGSYSINALDSEPSENSTLVNINYIDLASTTYHLRFHYMSLGSGMIWMNNQNQVTWRRTSVEPIVDSEFK